MDQTVSFKAAHELFISFNARDSQITLSIFSNEYRFRIGVAKMFFG